jgi:dihydrofolate reductase
MAKLIYSAIASLDGYVADREGNFDWAAPGDEVHAFVNELERPVGTYLYGRRMYEVMAPWETMDTGPGEPVAIRDFARIWRAADKVVFSRTLARPTTARTSVERDFDRARVREMKASSSRDLTIGGPALAGQAIRAGLVDELQLFLAPVIVGGGTRFLPMDVGLELELLDERRFGDGTVFLRYRTESSFA